MDLRLLRLNFNSQWQTKRGNKSRVPNEPSSEPPSDPAEEVQNVDPPAALQQTQEALPPSPQPHPVTHDQPPCGPCYESLLEAEQHFEFAVRKLRGAKDQLLALQRHVLQESAELDERKAMAERLHLPERIRLNVGGTLFETTIKTLCREPDSLLAELFSGRCTLTQDQDGRYFLDRDGKTFEKILRYLRDGELATYPVDEIEYRILLREAEALRLNVLKKKLQTWYKGKTPEQQEETHTHYQQTIERKFKYPGDNHGLFFWLGTGNGGKWENPYSKGKVRILTSEPLDDAKKRLLVEHSSRLVAPPMAGVCRSSHGGETFVEFNLEGVCSVYPECYSIRRACSCDGRAIASWDFEGWNGREWVLLKAHRDDRELENNPIGVWALQLPKKAFFTKFRLVYPASLNAAAAAAAGRDGCLHFWSFELYGEVQVHYIVVQ